jgi:hypothetical protein
MIDEERREKLGKVCEWEEVWDLTFLLQVHLSEGSLLSEGGGDIS